MKTVSFYGTCAAKSEKTLVSQRISHAYKMKKVFVTFPAGVLNLMQVKIFIGIDDESPATGEPTGINIFRDYGQVEYVVGENTKKELEHEVDIAEMGTYLKVYAYNDDFFDHAIDVQIQIEA